MSDDDDDVWDGGILHPHVNGIIRFDGSFVPLYYDYTFRYFFEHFPQETTMCASSSCVVAAWGGMFSNFSLSGIPISN